MTTAPDETTPTPRAINAPPVGTPDPDGRYAYAVGYVSTRGAFGRAVIRFAYPITASDLGEAERLIREQHPDATVVAISPLAPPRTWAE